MQMVRGLLEQTRPFIQVVALLFGVLAAWLALTELLPFLGQIWKPRGTAQTSAIIAAALALVAGSR